MSDAASVTVAYAQTLDGRIATRSGQSQWISGPESLQLSHELRASHDAVMVGVGTAIADDPCLTVRFATGKSPHRVVVDSTLRVPLTAKVLTDRAARTTIATTLRAPEHRVADIRNRGAEVLVVASTGTGHVDLDDLLHCLAALGVRTVLVEGGRSLITSILHARLARRLVITIAPKLIGAGIEAVGDLGIDRLDDALTCTGWSFRQCGDDIVFDGQLEPSIS